MAKTTGYSRTPLTRKLGIKENCRFKVVNKPSYYFTLFEELPAGIKVVSDKKSVKDIIHYFTSSAKQLAKDLPALKKEMDQNGSLWISWPKQSSGVATDLNENDIRDLALRSGLVDVKVCAVDDTWSGLKLVIRVKDRKLSSSGG